MNPTTSSPRRSQRKRTSKSMPVIYPPSDDNHEDNIHDVQEEGEDHDDDDDSGEADEAANIPHRAAVYPPRARRTKTNGHKASHHYRSSALSVRRAQSVTSISGNTGTSSVHRHHPPQLHRMAVLVIS